MIRNSKGEVVDYVISRANEAYLRGLGGQSALGKRLLELRPEIEASWFEACGAILASGKPKRLEYWDAHLRRWFDANLTPISPDELMMLYVDVTRRKEAVARAQDRLLELNHRVKNNLNLVAAMLGLQARVSDSGTRLALEQAIARVHTISEVHNLLHRATATDTIPLARYLEDLCQKLQQSLAPPRTTLLVNAEAFEISIEQAVR